MIGRKWILKDCSGELQNSKHLAFVKNVNRMTERTVRTGILLPGVPRDVDGVLVDDEITHAADVSMTKHSGPQDWRYG
jgi:hypothetical protein